MISTKPYTLKDHAFVHQVHRLAYRVMIERQFGYWDEARQSGMLDCDLATDCYEIVLWANEPCGYFSFSTEGGRFHLIDIAILPRFQRRGIGGMLLEMLKKRARQKDQPMSLGAYKTNVGARRFYERHGFQRSDETTVHILYRWQG